jgi:hypothetical protein
MSAEHVDRFLLEALEILPKEATEDERFAAWGKIIADPEIMRLTGVDGPRIKRSGERPSLKVEFISAKSVADVVVAMSLPARRALRDRVSERGHPR